MRAVAAIASAPAEAAIIIEERVAKRCERSVPRDLYQAEDDWECRLHNCLGVPWPCPAVSEFWPLWQDVIEELKAKGMRVGPNSYLSWNDGDAGFVRAIWCLVRHLRPDNVVETGVGHGVTSRFILEALERNGAGHLWSIDRPPLNHKWHSEIGVAVGGRYPTRWSFVKGSSRRHLPSVLSDLGQVDIFIHDSLHSERNVRFEMDRVWPVLRPGGVVVVDDIDANWGFYRFTQAYSGLEAVVCEAEPLEPDLRRFNAKGLFGIALKRTHDT